MDQDNVALADPPNPALDAWSEEFLAKPQPGRSAESEAHRVPTPFTEAFYVPEWISVAEEA